MSKWGHTEEQSRGQFKSWQLHVLVFQFSKVATFQAMNHTEAVVIKITSALYAIRLVPVVFNDGLSVKQKWWIKYIIYLCYIKGLLYLHHPIGIKMNVHDCTKFKCYQVPSLCCDSLRTNTDESNTYTGVGRLYGSTRSSKVDRELDSTSDEDTM